VDNFPAVTFIEVHINEDYSELEKSIRDAHTSRFKKAAPSVRFGRVIVWQGRMFQQLEFSGGWNALEHEDKIFCSWGPALDRARIQLGSIRGGVFTTPAEAEGEPAARIREGRRCGGENVVQPFYYLDYDHDD
jgi:hypothetical protein